MLLPTTASPPSARPAARRVGGIIWRGGGQDASSGRFTASNERVLQRPLQAHRAFLRLGTLPI